MCQESSPEMTEKDVVTEDEITSRLHETRALDYKDTPQFQFSVVVAIDFGTTFSGYAYSFTHDPENIHIMRKWEGKFNIRSFHLSF